MAAQPGEGALDQSPDPRRDADRWKQVDDLLRLLQERPQEETEAILRKACAGDAAFEREVRSLLAAQRSAGSFLESPAIEVAARRIGIAELPSEERAGLLTGTVISQYRILHVLGAGGMGVVYKAIDTRLDRPVALKFLAPHIREDKELKRRLTEEARAASSLDHSNIVVVHDIGESPTGDMFIVMAFHEGATLREAIAAGLPLPEALGIARQVAAGLGAAHSRGIVHRDIKPANVMVSKDGISRIIDFGLAKSMEATATIDGSAKGTPLYMSPEQASGASIDFRSDLWSLGAVLYEMAAGKPAFRGGSHLQVMRAIVNDAPPRLRDTRPDLPAALDNIIAQALQKDPSKRYQSADKMASDLADLVATLVAPAPTRVRRSNARLVSAVALAVIAAGLFAWFYRRSERKHWAREEAMPKIAALTAANKPLAAFLLARDAARFLPGDAQLTQLADAVTRVISLKSSPPGASVEIKDYLSPDDSWFRLGNTPLNDIRIPVGYLRFRVTKPGFGVYLGAPSTYSIHGPAHEINFPLEPTADIPEGMVPVPAADFFTMVWSLGEVGPYKLPSFFMDRYEVTNRQFQDFVDKGGYRKREYWKEKFIRDGRELSWDEAIDLLRDSSGRPGPSTWEAGHFPAGREDYPVGGVSWYEASAYAEFAGKSLPAIAQWYQAAPASVGKYIIPLSNFSHSAPSRVGSREGIGPWGTYDMAGNVTEWCLNQAGSEKPNARYALGGAWLTPPSDYSLAVVHPPLDRSEEFGFRCVRNRSPPPAEVTAPKSLMSRDFTKLKPVSDDVFRAYQTMYAYETTPLNAKVETVAQDSPDWRKEKITFDAAYGKERVTAWLFLPAKIRPPFQTVVFYPSDRILDIANSSTLGDLNFVDYVIRSGRAVLYPVYKETYERQDQNLVTTPAVNRGILIQQSKDLGRSIDYLQTRGDIDHDRIGYLGVSVGAENGVIFAALEPRLKVLVFLDGGFDDDRRLPGTDQIDFVTRIRVPALLISGRFDWVLHDKDTMVRMFATPADEKKSLIFETGHDVTDQKADLVREVTGWLDKYLGRVN